VAGIVSILYLLLCVALYLPTLFIYLFSLPFYGIIPWRPFIGSIIRETIVWLFILLLLAPAIPDIIISDYLFVQSDVYYLMFTIVQYCYSDIHVVLIPFATFTFCWLMTTFDAVILRWPMPFWCSVTTDTWYTIVCHSHHLLLLIFIQSSDDDITAWWLLICIISLLLFLMPTMRLRCYVRCCWYICSAILFYRFVVMGIVDAIHTWVDYTAGTIVTLPPVRTVACYDCCLYCSVVVHSVMFCALFTYLYIYIYHSTYDYICILCLHSITVEAISLFCICLYCIWPGRPFILQSTFVKFDLNGRILPFILHWYYIAFHDC